jgi:uncharacterized membrane protein YuzA (DUF378 family)
MFSEIVDRFDSMDQTYVKKLLFQVVMMLLIACGVNFVLLGLFEVDILGDILGDGVFDIVLYVLIGLSILFVATDRDTYLPFLGPMVAPCSVLKDQSPSGATKNIKVTVAPHTKVLYWAAEPATENLKRVPTWKEAYLQYNNAGVATSDVDGVAVLKVRDPQPYRVPFKGLLAPHVHYRVCGEAGWMGPIRTTFVNPSAPEGFKDALKGVKGRKGCNYADSAAMLNAADSSASQF